MFIQAKISDGKFKIDGATNASDALKLAGEIIPEVGGVLVKVSEIMELAEEKQIIDKLKKISLLVPDDSRSIISEYVASKLTIKRRAYIQDLKMEELKYQCSCFEKVALLFDDTNVYNLRAQFDIKIIEAKLLLWEESDLRKYQMEGNYSEKFSSALIYDFMGDVMLKYVSPALQNGEVPDFFQIQKHFTIIPYYLANEFCRLPPLTKKLPNELEKSHRERVEKYLLACDEQRFTEIAQIIDPGDEIQMGFFNLYNEV